MKNLFGFLSGYKTYLIGAAGVVYGLGVSLNWWHHTASLDLVLGSSGLMTMRAAIAKMCDIIAAAARNEPLRPGDRILPILIAVCFLSLGSTAFAGPESTPAASPAIPPAWYEDVTQALQGASNAHAAQVIMSPSYAPKLADKWGFSLALLYPLGTDFTFVGLRGDLLGGDTFAGSASAGLKTDLHLVGLTVTPFASAGVVSKLSGAGGDTLEPGAIIGTGILVKVYEKNNVSVSLLGELEHWTHPSVEVYHIGAQVSFRW